MAAIGISPCPPFAHRAGLPPGVIWDGNTAVWYKYNDPVAGCVRDGANRVSFWFDKYNYAVGAEMVNQAAWYTAAYWNTFDANWTQVGVRLDSDGNNGNLIKLAFWIIGATYKITITCVRAGGSLAPPYDGAVPATPIVLSGTYTYYYTPSATTLELSSALFLGYITAISIRRITGNHLLQATAASQPLWSAANGVLFDGANDFMKATGFAFIQPEMIYFVVRHITWTNSDDLFDGNAAGSRGLIRQLAISPGVEGYAGLFSLPNNNLLLNTFSIIRSLFDGINSVLQINQTIAVLYNCGALNMNGFTLGSTQSGVGGFANIEVKEIILRRTADNAATQASIYNYLKTANGVP